MSYSSCSKPTFILSGLSGTGKSCMIEDARVRGIGVLRTFNKFLLDMRFGNGSKSHDFLVNDSLMQVMHLSDYDSKFRHKKLLIERSILDQYFFLTRLDGFNQSQDEVGDMNHVILLYFNYVTDGGMKPLIIVDILNRDETWIQESLDENWTRSRLIPDVESYLKIQTEYKTWFYSKLLELGIKFHSICIPIFNVKSDFTPDMRRSWIDKYIVGDNTI